MIHGRICPPARNHYFTGRMPCSRAQGNKFMMIIDEWDAPIREIPRIQKRYLERSASKYAQEI